MLLLRVLAILMLLPLLSPAVNAETVDTTEKLVQAVRDGANGSTIDIAPGTYKLHEPLEPKPGMTLQGAGIQQTIITHIESWKPSTSTLPDPEMTTKRMDTRAFLVTLPKDAANITISDLTFTGPQLHGAIFGQGNTNLHLHHIRFREFLWTSVRTFSLKRSKIRDCDFIDAGGRFEHGQPSTKGGISSGAIFAIWMEDTEIFNNRFTRTRKEKSGEFYGIKGRQGKRCRIHHNTINVNFSMEFPFENDENMEIDHNICSGTISIPKHAGGPVPKSGKTFHIHHNWMRDSYSIEFVRNGVEVDHNLFDFDVKKDHGNLISGFGKATAQGPSSFHDNYVSNPGRGVIWINEVFNHLTIRNNTIKTNTTSTPRKDGLIGLNEKTDFKTVVIENNIIECVGQPRPLLRAQKSYNAVIRNNKLINVPDTTKYDNPQTGEPIGPDAPLKFECGVQGEVTVDGWSATPTAK